MKGLWSNRVFHDTKPARACGCKQCSCAIGLRITKQIKLTLRKREKAWFFGDVLKFFLPSVAAFPAWYENLRMVEIGLAYGGLTDHILGELRTANVWAVDPFLSGYDDDNSQSIVWQNISANHGTSDEGFSEAWGCS